MAAEETKRSGTLLWGFALLLVVLAAYFYFHSTRHVVKVHTSTVQRDDLVSTISTNGKVEPLEDFQAHAPAPGTIEDLYVSVGDHVAKGQKLMLLDSADAAKQVAGARANLAATESSLANMQAGGSTDERLAASADMTSAVAAQQQAASAVNTLVLLQAKGSASANEVASARQKLSDASARVAQLKARTTGRYSSGDLGAQRAAVSEAHANVAAAQNSYSGVDIRAPFAGTVYSLPISQYDFVNAGEALLDVADLRHLEVRAYFDEPEIGQLAVGQSVKIVWDAKPLRTWHGHITQAPTTVISYGTRSVGECLITVDDADGEILPNTNVTVTVTTQKRENVLSLPREALHTEGTSNYVFRIVDGRLVRTVVQVGVVNLTRVEITAGLNVNDTVSLNTTDNSDLSDGLRVTVQP